MLRHLYISNMHLRHPSVAGEVLDEVCVLVQYNTWACRGDVIVKDTHRAH